MRLLGSFSPRFTGGKTEAQGASLAQGLSQLGLYPRQAGSGVSALTLPVVVTVVAHSHAYTTRMHAVSSSGD